MSKERDFKGIWIPREVWLSEDLTIQEKVFLVEILSLDNENGCFAGNDYFSNFFGLSKTRVSVIINNLVKKGYITSTIKYKEGTKQILNRVLKEARIPSPQKQGYPTIENSKDNNTVNNTVNNTKNNTKSNTKNNIINRELKAKYSFFFNDSSFHSEWVKLVEIAEYYNQPFTSKVQLQKLKAKTKEVKVALKLVIEQQNFIKSGNKISNLL